jgi:hypothetical protein
MRFPLAPFGTGALALALLALPGRAHAQIYARPVAPVAPYNVTKPVSKYDFPPPVVSSFYGPQGPVVFYQVPPVRYSFYDSPGSPVATGGVTSFYPPAGPCYYPPGSSVPYYSGYGYYTPAYFRY